MGGLIDKKTARKIWSKRLDHCANMREIYSAVNGLPKAKPKGHKKGGAWHHN